MKCSNLHLMWKKEMVSLLQNSFQASSKFGLYFMFVLKTAHTYPGSHDEVIYYICFVMPISLTEFENCSIWHNLRYQVWSTFCVSSVIGIPVVCQSESHLEPREGKRLSRHRLLVGKFHFYEIHRYVMQRVNQYL